MPTPPSPTPPREAPPAEAVTAPPASRPAPPASRPAPPASRLDALRARFARFEPFAGALAFVAGFAWDSLTLTRIDKLSDNLILLAYLLALGGTVALNHRVATAPERWPRLAPRREWVDFAARFFFGGLFSAYVVYYFKSAATWPSLAFVALLGALMVANEFAPGRLEHLRLRVALFTFCAFSFLLFFIPVVTGLLGYGVFLTAWALALLAGAAIGVLAERGSEPPRALARRHLASAAAVLVPLFIADLADAIPPIPLSLTDRGVYHSVERTDAGYELTWQKAPWRPWRREDVEFHLDSGKRVYCFSAVFAPTGTGLSIFHVWQKSGADGWHTTDRIPFEVLGGRGGGFRGYTYKKNVTPGEWRVLVESDEGRELGRCRFTAVEGAGPGEVWKTRVVP